MCGRFALWNDPGEIARELGVQAPPDLTKRYNVAPSQLIPAVRANSENNRELVRLVWGLVPFWAKERRIGYRMINARAESIAQKSAFKVSFRRRRCLIPASGFFEWRRTEDKGKQPYFVRLKNRDLLAFAGLWDRWKDRESGEEIESCTIITTEANELVRRLHDRMPAVVRSEHYGQWLDPGTTEPKRLQKLLGPYPAGEMEIHPVSRDVNSPANDRPDVVEPS